MRDAVRSDGDVEQPVMPVTSDPVLSPSGTRCAFCEHVNPPAAKYCNECASDLQLILCELCSAVNRRGMPQCHKCGGALIEQSTEPPVAAPPVATPSATMTSRPRSIRPLVAVIAVLAAVTIGARASEVRLWATPRR